MQYGTLSLATNGTFTYTPAAGFYGTDSFTYDDSDGLLISDVATVTIAVTDSAPLAANNAYSMTSGGTLSETTTPTGVLGNDIDADGDTLTAILVTNVQHGTLSLAGNGTFTYTPAPGYYGTDSFTYEANDGAEMSNIATAVFDVAEIAPVADEFTFTLSHDSVLTTTAANGVMASYAGGDTVTVSLVSGVRDGALSLNSDGSFTYTPAAGFYGTDSFAYQLSDGLRTSGITSVTLNVIDTSAPVAVNDVYTVPHDTTLAVSSGSAGVLGNDTDADGDSLTASLVTSTADGSLTLNPDGTFTYVPDAGYYGQDSFTYQASDGRDRASSPPSRSRSRRPARPPPWSPTRSSPTSSARAHSIQPGRRSTVPGRPVREPSARPRPRLAARIN